MLCVAYGSNISEKWMQKHCPSAKFVAKGFLKHTALCFHYYATIERAHDYETPVVVWDIAESEVLNLDRAEGYPKHYVKKDVLVVPRPTMTVEQMAALVGADNVHVQGDFMDDPSGIWGTAYVMTEWKKHEWEKHGWQTPIEYVEHLLAGYREQGSGSRRE